jgi:hypothetical protein
MEKKMLRKNNLKNLYKQKKKISNEFNYPQLATVIHAALYVLTT